MAEDSARRLVALVEAAQGRAEFGWAEGPGGVEHVVVDDVTFIPSHIERALSEGRHTPSSRAAMFLLPLSLSALYGAYSIWDERTPLPQLLLVGGLASLALGIAAARRSARSDAARDPHYVFRKGLYLAPTGALVVQGIGRDDDDLRFYPRSTIAGTAYVLSGRTRQTKLVLRDQRAVFAHVLDVRPIVDAWLAADA